jgi:hypothetical protein
VYQIRIKGHLSGQWAEWFEGLTITLERNGDTVLTGPVVDQAALHGLLKRVRDLGMPLVAVSPVDKNAARRARRIQRKHGAERQEGSGGDAEENGGIKGSLENGGQA